MQQARGSNHARRSPITPSHHFPDARGFDAGDRGESGDGQAERAKQREDQEERDRIERITGYLMRRGVLQISSGFERYELAIPFLAKLADSIVSLRDWLQDDKKPILHHAILLTMIDFHGGVHSKQVSEAALFVEAMICEDLEFRLLNK